MNIFGARNYAFWVAHASRVLPSVSCDRELFLNASCWWKSLLNKGLFRRDGETSARDACATQTCAATHKSGLVLPLVLVAIVRAHGLTPGDLSHVKFEQHPGQQLSGDLVFQDENGRALKLGELFGKRPVILVPGYYRCPMLCTMINDGLINALENLRANVGSDFDVVDLSIDPNEKPNAAAEKKALCVRRYGRTGAAAGWHCLVGSKKSIAQLTDELGYRYAYDPETKEYAHPSGVIVLTPDGKISRYVFGVTFNSTELRDAIAAAKDGKSGSVLSQLFLLCYHYNPITGRYGALIMSILRISSITLVSGLGLLIFYLARARVPSPQSSPSGRGSREASGEGFWRV
jgi:protein SCO1/2